MASLTPRALSEIIEFSNTDGSSQFIPGKGDTTFSGNHGTQVAGIVAAATDNVEGIASLGWNIKMIPYHWTGFSDTTVGNLPAKIDTAVNVDNVNILDFSFKTTHKCIENNSCLQSWDYKAVSDAIKNALIQGVIVVASAGNISINAEASLRVGRNCPGDPVCDPFPYNPYPASYSFAPDETGLPDTVEVIGVSATDSLDNFVTGWNHGSFVDVSAPGKDIISTSGMENYISVSGTSFSSPHVAALAGLILSINSTLNIQQVQNIIETTAEDVNSTAYPGYDEYIGHGRINAYQALLLTLAYSNQSEDAMLPPTTAADVWFEMDQAIITWFSTPGARSFIVNILVEPGRTLTD